MAKRTKKILALMMAASLSLNMAAVTVLADDVAETVTAEATTSGDGTLESPKVTVTQETGTNSDGNAVTTTTTTTEASGTTDTGATVTQTETTQNNVVSDSVGNTIKEYGNTTGSETTTTVRTDNPETKVELESEQTTTATSGATTTTVTGPDEKENEQDTEYDQTTTTETPREVTATMGKTETTAHVSDEKNNLTPIQPDYDGTEEDIKYAPENQIADADYTDQPEGYDFIFVGSTGEWSKYDVNVYENTEEDSGEDSEDGEVGSDEVEETPKAEPASATHIQITDMSDPENRVNHTVYCVEGGTVTKNNYWYRIDNLEEVDYYENVEDEDHIRAIVMNGYWATTEGTGSLDSIKQMLKDAGEDVTGLTDEEIEGLTEGEAITATQAAIWKYASHYNGVEIPDYDGDGEEDLNEKRIRALFNYLTTLKESASEDNTTEIITEEKFVDDLSFTVKDKVDDGDDDDTNDTYNVDLGFTMVVVPDKDNDNLLVKVIDSEGNVVKTVRIAGDSSSDGDDIETIDANASGEYVITGLQLAENSDIKFSLKIEGTQYLKEGVYFYSSEVRTDDDGNPVNSQNFVGIASGDRAVDVDMAIQLRFNVEEGTVTQERIWAESWENDGDDDGYGGDEGGEEEDKTEEKDEEDSDDGYGAGEGGQEEVVEEAVLEGEAPRTGDTSALWMALSALSGLGAAGLGFTGKKRSK